MLFSFFYRLAQQRDLHSFPTRRSSDLVAKHLRLRLADLNRHIASHHELAAPTTTPGFVEVPPPLSCPPLLGGLEDRKSTRLNSSHVSISYAVFCLKKKIMSLSR